MAHAVIVREIDANHKAAFCQSLFCVLTTPLAHEDVTHPSFKRIHGLEAEIVVCVPVALDPVAIRCWPVVLVCVRVKVRSEIAAIHPGAVVVLDAEAQRIGQVHIIRHGWISMAGKTLIK